MRRAGEPLAYTNGMEARTVVILEFLWKVRRVTCIEYDIAVVIVDNDRGGSGGGFASLGVQ
ncbi:hypothetical protein ACHWGL_31215, partial [Klebsiella pneumoniae]|uniref:hypothetical protein n=1 Tax=Klebsiella pneumoniae TaxID=573 RepID=UPI00376F0A6E